LVVNKLENFILLKEMLQVESVVDEKWQTKEETLWKQRFDTTYCQPKFLGYVASCNKVISFICVERQQHQS
jgi:hypothetical protein